MSETYHSKQMDVYHYKVLQSLKPSDKRLDDFKIGGLCKIKEPSYTISGENRGEYVWKTYKLVDVTSRGLYIFKTDMAPKGKSLMWKEILMMLDTGDIKAIK